MSFQPGLLATLAFAAILVSNGLVVAQEAELPKAPPELDGVEWVDEGITLGLLRGKAVVILIHANASRTADPWADEMLAQLKAAITDRPIVVLVVSADKQGTGVLAYMKQRGFVAPDILHGRDPLMPARLGLTNDRFQYVLIGPQGNVIAAGHAGTHYALPDGKKYVLPMTLTKAGDRVGQFDALRAEVSPQLKQVLWPLELGRSVSNVSLTKIRRDLEPEEQAALDAAVTRCLKKQLERIAVFAQGEIADKLLAVDKATLLASDFKGTEHGQQAKDLLAEMAKDPELKREVAAKRSYEKAVDQAARNPALGQRLLQTTAKTFKGTHYGQMAARSSSAGSAEPLPASIRMWPSPSDDEQKASVEQQKTYLGDVRQRFNGVQLRQYESEHFLFLSDIPAQIITTMYLPYLDQMYAALCQAFALDPEKNVWKGKALILAFADKESFLLFEAAYFPDAVHLGVTAQGLCHQATDGTVLISCYAGSDPKYFATVLVHETAHGFQWRYKAAEEIPSWLAEGGAEWIAQKVVPGDLSIQRKTEEAIKRMLATRSMGGDFFTAGHIAGWQYGAAASMTDFLLKFDSTPQGRRLGKSQRGRQDRAHRYRDLVEGIKSGDSWERSLQKAYGLTPAQLVAAYGEFVGIPGLQP